MVTDRASRTRARRPARRSAPTGSRVSALLLVFAVLPLQLSWSTAPDQWPEPPERGLAQHPRLAQAYPQPQANPWTFRPRSPSNARGVPPGPLPEQLPEQLRAPTSDSRYAPHGQWRGSRQQYPPPGGMAQGRYPGAGYAPYGQRPAGAEPRLEVTLLDARPYVQEPVLVRLDVVSAGNLATASPQMSGFESVLLEEIAGPTTRVRSSGREREIVNRYVLALTPLRPGPLEVGPLKVTGTLAGGVPFAAEAESPIRLDARPIVGSVRPWLPLQGLRLSRDLADIEVLEEGRPITMTLRMEATGGLGGQLPSLETMLASSDFRSYREQTIVESRIADDGRQLIGTRTEVYTLVPASGGRLQLPEVRVNWWNVETARRESSSVPIRSLSVAGDAGPFGFGRSRTAAGDDGKDWSWFWIPVGGLLLLLIGYWAGVWYRVKRPLSPERATRAVPLSRRIQAAIAWLGRGAVVLLRRLDPVAPARALRRKARARLRRWTPASVRVYRCALDAERARSASEWALLFQTNACQSLSTPSREPLPRVADRILRMRPGADHTRVRGLIRQLDVALYNGGELDFARWKRDLRRALRPFWGVFAGSGAGRVRRRRLPELNPRPEGH